MPASDNCRVIVEDLAAEVASLIADYRFSLWEEPTGNSEMCRKVNELCKRFPAEGDGYLVRRMCATVVCRSGFQGFPGVVENILEMIRQSTITARSTLTDLPLVQDLTLTGDLRLLYVTKVDAEVVRQRLLPETLKANIQFKVNEGRYTLEEAASLLDELCLLTEEDGETDQSFDDIMNKLSTAALDGELPVYLPGKSVRYSYGSSCTSRVREYYEEVYWHDLNKWLADNKTKVEYRFPDPEAAPAPAVDIQATPRGVTKREILSVDWPMPRNAPPLKNILDEIPKWVDSACIKIGRPGKGVNGSHLWNPALLALCLGEATPHKRWTVVRGELTNFIRLNFPDYFEQWEATE